MNTEDFLQYQPSAALLKNRVIVITGAGAGIGKALALAAARHGATVVLLGRTLSKLEAVYDQIEAEQLPTAAIFPINLESATAEDYSQLHNALQEEFGSISGLVHNAGVLGDLTPLDNYNFEQWQQVMAVNVTAPFMLTKHLLPLLKKSDQGRIIFTGSSVGRKGRAYWGAYAVSKGATETLMQVLADELEQTHIRVHSINPGATRTQMRSQAYPAETPAQVTPPEDICNRYLYLLGSDSSGHHGGQWDAQPKPQGS